MAIINMFKNFIKKTMQSNLKLKRFIMDKKILIDASQEKQTRVAITNNGNVDGYEFENINKKQLKGNIYLGKVSRIEPSLQAAFVDFGNERHGFLAFNDIQSEYYQLPQSDKDALKQEEEEIREELNKATENIEENQIEDQEALDENVQSDVQSNTDKENQVSNENSEVENNENNNALNENQLDKKIEKIEVKEKRYRIQEVIKPGQVILIQIVKEERGKKRSGSHNLHLTCRKIYCFDAKYCKRYI